MAGGLMAPVLLIVLHALAAVAWVGGIFFAYMALRPASMMLEAQPRLALWDAVFSRFFPWVWLFVVVLLGSGHTMLGAGLFAATPAVAAMAGLGWVMALLFTYLYWLPYQRLRRSVAAGDVPGAAAAMQGIRPIVGTNLVLGLVTSGLGAASHFLG